MSNADRFTKLVERMASWTDEECAGVDARQARHIAQVVLAGADPEYPAFAKPAATASDIVPVADLSRHWSHRLLDLGDNDAGDHRGVSMREVHFDNGKPLYFSSKVVLETFRDDFETLTPDSYREAIICQLERLLDVARSRPILSAAEIGA